MKLSKLIGALVGLVLLFTALTAGTEATIQNALDKEIAQHGDFYTWSFEKKADFYNTHVYHGVGTRRRVPCSHVLPKEAILEAAQNYMISTAGLTEKALAAYIVDMDYWIDVLPEENVEHEYYSVLYMTPNRAPSIPRGIPADGLTLQRRGA